MNHTLESQEAVFALLADPATHDGAKVKRIDTHAATVFLAGARAFKVKRAVRFPFLDYSSLDKRKAACEADNKCRAWTYSRPGYLGASARCFLKHQVKPPRRKPCCISGVVR